MEDRADDRGLRADQSGPCRRRPTPRQRHTIGATPPSQHLYRRPAGSLNIERGDGPAPPIRRYRPRINQSATEPAAAPPRRSEGTPPSPPAL